MLTVLVHPNARHRTSRLVCSTVATSENSTHPPIGTDRVHIEDMPFTYGIFFNTQVGEFDAYFPLFMHFEKKFESNERIASIKCARSMLEVGEGVQSLSVGTRMLIWKHRPGWPDESS